MDSYHRYANTLTKPAILLTSPQMPDLENMTDVRPPRVWVLTTEKLGDNAQVLAIADALGWPYEVKRLEFTSVNHSRTIDPLLWELAVARSSPLVPPWPDLLLTIGRRPSPMALGIRRRSGGKTKLVQVGQGESRVGFACFDLVVGNPQCLLPARPNLVQLELPLLYGKPVTIAAAVAQWEPQFLSLPRPWTALFVGGATAPLILNAEVSRRMMGEIKHLMTREGGSLLVTTSPRTSTEVANSIEAGMLGNGFFHRWVRGGQSNPYPAILGLADRFIVTGDSISMLTEVVRQGKPLAIYPLPSRTKSIGKSMWRWSRHMLRGLLFPPGEATTELGRWRGGAGDCLIRLGLLQYHRDFSRFHQQLVDRGLAVRFGTPFLPVQTSPPDDLPMVVERIKALFGKPPA